MALPTQRLDAPRQFMRASASMPLRLDLLPRTR